MLLALPFFCLDDWPAFRGPAGTGISVENVVPVEWGPSKSIRWKAPLPHPGNGSPIVSNGRVFVTCPEDAAGLKRSLYCFDRATGRQHWVRTIEFGKKMPRHPENPHSSSTPAADGKRVVVWHDSAGLFCYDFEGQELWSRNLGEFAHMWAHGSSPILYQGKVILNCGPGLKRNFMTAIRLADGKTLWETDEPFGGDGNHNENKNYMGSWCTPVLAKVDGKDQILCSQPKRLVAYDPADGKTVWWCEGLRHGGGDLAYSSPVICGDICMVVGGFGGPGMSLRLGGGQADVTETHRLWRNERNPQNIGSGVYWDGHVFWPQASDRSIFCIDPKTGKILWRDKSSGADHWGSVVLAGGNLYVTNQRGATIVFKPSAEKFELVAKNDLGERSNSTPAISDGQIFIRTFEHLYCIEK